MKKVSLVSFLSLAKVLTSFAQNAVTDSKLKSATTITYQYVSTQSINVGGTDFYYRRLGENNAGVPVIFLNH